MGKQKEIKIPKYLRLNKGVMWMDNDGDDSSGVVLYKTSEVFVGRGCKDNSRIPIDMNGNKDATDGSYGSIEFKTEVDKSYFCTDDIPKEKLSRILTAMQADILVPFSPDDPIEEDLHGPMKKNFKVKRDGDVVFDGQNATAYKKLMNANFTELVDYVEKCDGAQVNHLIDMYHYENRGYNPLNRPRLEVLDLIRKRLSKFGPRMSPLRVNDIEDEIKE